jgi:hypothetical protein
MSEKNQRDIATEIMAVMVRMPPNPHKATPKAATPKGEAQRQRRQREKEAAHRRAP